MYTSDLQHKRADAGWQQALETTRAAFCFRKRCSFVQTRIVKNVIAGDRILVGHCGYPQSYQKRRKQNKPGEQ
jgi:hypothetical protein